MTERRWSIAWQSPHMAAASYDYLSQSISEAFNIALGYASRDGNRATVRYHPQPGVTLELITFAGGGCSVGATLKERFR